MTDTVESVLAEMRDHFDDDREAFDEFKVRLAAAHERETGALRNDVARYEQKALLQQQERLSAHCRAEAAEALLREARNWIDNDTDEVAAVIARIDARLGATNG